MDNHFKKYDLKQFNKDLEKLSISLTDCQMEQFLIYYEMLTEKNKVIPAPPNRPVA